MSRRILIGSVLAAAIFLCLASVWKSQDENAIQKSNLTVVDDAKSSFTDTPIPAPLAPPPGKLCKGFFHKECACFKKVCRKGLSGAGSMCSAEATHLGEGQKVFSYSLYGSKTKWPYERGLSMNLLQMRTLYPDWVMRLYTDHPLLNGSHLCSLLCASDDFFVCNVTALPGLGNISPVFGMTWRFVPLGDMSVASFMSRDLDSALTKRGLLATRQWEDSGKTFHFIRDHFSHTYPVLGGMFGVKGSLLEKEEREGLLRAILQASKKNQKWGADQNALAKVLYVPKYHPASLAHDRFHCATYNQTQCIPLPPLRKGEAFIGDYDRAVRSGP